MLVFNASIRAFKSYLTSPKARNSYIIAHTCIGILFLTEKWKENEFNCFYFTAYYTDVLPTLSLFGLLMSKEKLEGKEL